MITILGTALVNWNALLKIIRAALIGGTGLLIGFGFLLMGILRGRTADNPTERFALFPLSGVCGVLCVAVAAEMGSCNLRGLVATRCASYDQRYNAETFPDSAGPRRGDDHHPRARIGIVITAILN